MCVRACMCVFAYMYIYMMYIPLLIVPSVSCQSRNTALSTAISSGHVAIAKILLAAGADANKASNILIS